MVLLAAALAGGALAIIPTASAAGKKTYVDTLKPGQKLRHRDVIRSHNGRQLLRLGPKQGASLWGAHGLHWASPAKLPKGGYLQMRADGNLVMYTRYRHPVWHTSTSGNPGAILRMQDDGNLVIYRNGQALWAASRTPAWAMHAERIERKRRLRASRLIRDAAGIHLIDYHVSRRIHANSTSRYNIVHTAAGEGALRSPWSRRGAGTRVHLKASMLEGMEKLRSKYQFTFRVSSIAGGTHSVRSRHYDGLAFDANYIDGRKVSSRHPSYRAFMQACRELGAVEVLGPGYPGHSAHVHCAW